MQYYFIIVFIKSYQGRIKSYLVYLIMLLGYMLQFPKLIENIKSWNHADILPSTSSYLHKPWSHIS